MDVMNAKASVLVLVDYQARLMPAIHRADEAAALAVLLAQAARLLDIPVIGTEQNPAGLGPNVAAVKAVCAHTLSKMHFDACADGLVPALQATRPGCREVVVAGCEAHVPVADRPRAGPRRPARVGGRERLQLAPPGRPRSGDAPAGAGRRDGRHARDGAVRVAGRLHASALPRGAGTRETSRVDLRRAAPRGSRAESAPVTCWAMAPSVPRTASRESMGLQAGTHTWPVIKRRALRLTLTRRMCQPAAFCPASALASMRPDGWPMRRPAPCWRHHGCASTVPGNAAAAANAIAPVPGNAWWNRPIDNMRTNTSISAAATTRPPLAM